MHGASSWEAHLKGAQVWIIQFYLQTHHTCPHLVTFTVHQRAPLLCVVIAAIWLQLTTHLSETGVLTLTPLSVAAVRYCSEPLQWHRKHMVCLWNRDAICNKTQDITTSGFGGRSLVSAVGRCQLMLYFCCWWSNCNVHCSSSPTSWIWKCCVASTVQKGHPSPWKSPT